MTGGLAALARAACAGLAGLVATPLVAGLDRHLARRTERKWLVTAEPRRADGRAIQWTHRPDGDNETSRR